MNTEILETINSTIGGDKTSLAILEQKGVFKSYNKGFRVYPSDNLGFLYLINGKIRFLSTSENAKEITIFNITSKESCIISTSCIFRNINADVSLEFVEDSRAFVLPNAVFERLITQNENIMQFNLSLISKRLKQAFDTIYNVTFESLKNRIIKFLLENEKDGVVLASQEEIANNIGSAREAVTRVIKELRDDNLITTNRNKITLSNTLKAVRNGF